MTGVGTGVGAGGAPRTGDPATGDRPRRRRLPWTVVGPLLVYAGLGLVAYWPSWPGDPSRIPFSPAEDPGQMTWFLAWTPHALAHGENPFFTTAINHPVGVNLALNTLVPLLGLVAAPVTLVFGPVSSLNLLLWLAFPLSAGSMYLVLRRWTGWWPAAFAGGLIYGFGPYMVGHSSEHLNLIFVPLPPLILLAAFELLVRREGRPVRWGVALGLLAVGQLYISPEILVSTVFFGTVALVVVAVARRGSVLPALRESRWGIAWAIGIAVVAGAWPAWMMLFGPQRYHVPYATIRLSIVLGNGSDLVGPVAPTPAVHFGAHSVFGLLGALPSFALDPENGSYLGIPLLLACAYLVVRYRRDPWVRLSATMAVVAFVLSMGPRLVVDHHVTSFPLPFALFDRVRLLDMVVPGRMDLFTDLFVAVLVALGLARLHGEAVERREALRGEPRPRAWAGPVAVAVVATVVVVSLVPQWPVPTAPSAVPAYFTSSAVDRLPTGAVVLTYPLARKDEARPMLWQAEARIRFDLVGGYAFHTGPDGDLDWDPTTLAPSDVETFLFEQDRDAPAGSPPSPADATVAADLREFVAQNGVDALLVADDLVGSARVVSVATEAFGPPSVTTGGVTAWYGLSGH